MRHFIVICMVAVALPMIVVGATHQVDMINFAFVPDTLNINQGDSVLWINTTAIGHTTTSGVNGIPDGYWDSGLLAANDSFTFEFDSAGSFSYYCTPHWTLGMIGLIIVEPVGIQEYEYSVPGEFEVGNVYPNPFSQTAVLTYSLNIPQRVQVRIFNAAGQNIRVLADATIPSGTYTTLWDGRDALGNQVSSGTYFVQVSLGDRYVERKVLLLR